MKVILKTIGIVALTAVTFAGVWAGIGIKNLMNICWKITKYDFRVDLEYIYVNLTIQIRNPSHLSVGINGYKLGVYLNNHWVADVSESKRENLTPGELITINVPVKVKFIKTFGAIKSRTVVNAFLRKEFDKIYVTLKGNLDGNILGINKGVSVDEKFTFAEILKIMNEPASAPC